jgi:hypothetical protein
MQDDAKQGAVHLKPIVFGGRTQLFGGLAQSRWSEPELMIGSLGWGMAAAAPEYRPQAGMGRRRSLKPEFFARDCPPRLPLPPRSPARGSPFLSSSS